MNKDERKNYLKFYKKDYDLILHLSTEEKIGELFFNTLYYGNTAIVPEMSPDVKKVFDVIKKGIDDFWENG